jgi:hypothetical protein
MAKQDTLLSLANVRAVNEKGQAAVDIDRVDQHVVNTERLNFALPRRFEHGNPLNYRITSRDHPDSNQYYDKTEWIKHV